MRGIPGSGEDKVEIAGVFTLTSMPLTAVVFFFNSRNAEGREERTRSSHADCRMHCDASGDTGWMT